MIHEQSSDAVLLAASLGMLGGLLVTKHVLPLGAFATVLAVLVTLATAGGVGIWLLPNVETLVTGWEEREALEGGDRS